MGLVIETDLGSDVDDLFALLYFLGLGIDIDAVLISPGDKSQVAFAKALIAPFGRKIPVLTPAARVSKFRNAPFNDWVITKLGGALEVEADGHEESLPKHPVEVFICGPVKMAHLLNPTKITVQGGFVPYSKYRPTKTFDKFEGKETCATFNLGGTNKAIAQQVIDTPVERRFVGKNICHTVIYTPEIHSKYCPSTGSLALDIHKMAVEKYIEGKGAKMWHDPLAAVLSQNLDLGVWMALKPERTKGEYGVVQAEGGLCRSLVDLVQEPWTAYFDGLLGKNLRIN